jgi:hypothetical protein
MQYARQKAFRLSDKTCLASFLSTKQWYQLGWRGCEWHSPTGNRPLPTCPTYSPFLPRTAAPIRILLRPFLPPYPMRYLSTCLFLLLTSIPALAQTTLSGRVINEKGRPVSGALVSLLNTLDGGSSDSTGAFTFTTTETGAQTLSVSSPGYTESQSPITLTGGKMEGVAVLLKQSERLIETVTISAGAFEASGERKSVLTPLDIVTTAGAQADVVRAIQTLPGTQQQGTQPGLFVRGGDAGEALFVVDGLTVQNAFFSGPPGVATRSRFNPFQFKGYAFSSGGYSARYGQALSAVLELNTLDLPERSTVNLGLNMAGVYASGSRLWEDKMGLEGTAYYNNLQPFYGVANTNFDFYDVPKGGGGSAKWAWKASKQGMLKVMANVQHFSSGIEVPNPAVAGDALRFGIKNTTGWGAAQYRHSTTDNKWNFFTGALFSYNKDDNSWGTTPIGGEDDRTQLRAEARRFFTGRINLLTGVEVNRYSFSRYFGGYASDFTETNTAGYAELKWSPAAWITLLPGLRYEHSALLNTNTVAPRLSLALKTGLHSTVSLAGGIYYQNPEGSYLLAGYRPEQQRAVHAIANYLWQHNSRTLRLEVYNKQYGDLVREQIATGIPYDPNTSRFPYGLVDNSGSGYARGAELFWRDRKTLKNLDYWVSYSFIDTRRLYALFPVEATPEFIADHNASLVSKYWIEKWQMSLNATYSYATGRPYYNPVNPEFLGDRAPDYHNLAFTANYLTNVRGWFTVIYAGVDNIANRRNIFGYRYSTDGQQRYPQYPALFRSYFVGVNFSLSEFDKDEL